MKRLEKFLSQKEIPFSKESFGNPQYFNDGFSVKGIIIGLYGSDLLKYDHEMKELDTYLKRRKETLSYERYVSSGICYRIFDKEDKLRLDEHTDRINESVRNFRVLKGATCA